MAQGPEDTPEWKRLEENSISKSIDVCTKCGLPIQQWHCDALLCPWCEVCGKKSKPGESQRGVMG